ncbi:unnamed protein product, partial [Heterotrigona itama]
ESYKHVHSITQDVKKTILGLRIITGDNVTIVRELDYKIDAHLDLSTIKTDPLSSIISTEVIERRRGKLLKLIYDSTMIHLLAHDSTYTSAVAKTIVQQS